MRRGGPLRSTCLLRGQTAVEVGAVASCIRLLSDRRCRGCRCETLTGRGWASQLLALPRCCSPPPGLRSQFARASERAAFGECSLAAGAFCAAGADALLLKCRGSAEALQLRLHSLQASMCHPIAACRPADAWQAAGLCGSATLGGRPAVCSSSRPPTPRSSWLLWRPPWHRPTAATPGGRWSCCSSFRCDCSIGTHKLPPFVARARCALRCGAASASEGITRAARRWGDAPCVLHQHRRRNAVRLPCAAELLVGGHHLPAGPHEKHGAVARRWRPGYGSEPLLLREPPQCSLLEAPGLAPCRPAL